MDQQRPQSPTSNILLNNTSPHAPHKICLETSFTSLQSPLDPMPNCDGSSRASSLGGSIFGKSQLSSILQYDISSIMEDSGGLTKSLSGPSEATTIMAVEPKSDSRAGKNVAFDVSRSPFMMTPNSQHFQCVSPAPNAAAPKSILHKQSSSSTVLPPQPQRPDSLSMCAFKKDSQETIKKFDLIHDDWFGLAPLASPESLSEISSISSRASMAVSLAASIEKCLQGISLTNNDNKRQDVIEIDESQLHTPKILRRAPKITGNLSKCADDWRSVDTYKRMGQVFVTTPRVPSNESSDQSFETAISLSTSQCCNVDGINKILSGNSSTMESQSQRLQENSKSADNLDEENISDYFSGIKQLTNSDSAILHECISNCPRCPCRNLPPTGCCTLYDHTLCVSLKQYKINYYNNNTNTTSSSETYHSAFSSLTGIEPNSISNGAKIQFSDDQCSSINSTISLKSGVLESHFPVYQSAEHQSLLPQSPKQLKFSDKRIQFTNKNKRNNSDDKIFAKNESLPLLVNLSEKSSPTSYVKRKKYVYPMTTTTTTKKGESNV